MKKTALFLSLIFLGWASMAQSLIPVTTDGKDRVMTGFESIVYLSDEATFENAYLWVVDSICEVKKEGITATDFDAHTMKFNLAVASPADSKLNNQYGMTVSIRVQEHRLVYYISDLVILPRPGGMSKNPSPINKLTPDTKTAHADIINDLSQSVTAVIGNMLSFVRDNKPQAVSHWTEIKSGKPVKGMTTDECKLAFGKPQFVSEKNGEVQWMYSSNFYLFFIGGKVTSIIK